MSVTEVKLKYKLNISQEKKCQCRLGLGTHWYKQKRHQNTSIVVKTTNLRKKIFDSFHRLKFYLEWKDISHRHFKIIFIHFLNIRGNTVLRYASHILTLPYHPYILHSPFSILDPQSTNLESFED